MAAVLLSVSGETKEVLRVAQQLKPRNCSLIAITCSDQSSLSGLADLTLPYYTPIRHSENQIDTYDFSSQIPAVYLLESISRRVYNRLNE